MCPEQEALCALNSLSPTLSCDPWPGPWNPEKLGACVHIRMCMHMYLCTHAHVYVHIHTYRDYSQRGRQSLFSPGAKAKEVTQSCEWENSALFLSLIHMLACCQSWKVQWQRPEVHTMGSCSPGWTHHLPHVQTAWLCSQLGKERN